METNIAARVEAVLAGEGTFYPVTPCRNSGHMTLRSTADGRCIECRRANWIRWKGRHPAAARAHLEKLLIEIGVMEA